MSARSDRPGLAAVSGLPGADSLSAATRSEIHCNERAGHSVVESNRVAEVSSVATREGAGVEPGEGVAAVAGVRYAGVITGRGSGIVVVDDDLEGVIRVG